MKLTKGQVIIFPTDTIYGMGCLFNDEKAINRIYELKKREISKKLLVLCSSLDQIEALCFVDSISKSLIMQFMPGDLSLILNAKNGETLGVRIPNNKIAINLIEENGPLSTTSVNISKMDALNEYNQIKEIYNDKVDYILASDEASKNIFSTIIDMTKQKPTLIREGNLKFETILAFLDTHNK